MQKMNNGKFDSQELINLINNVKLASDRRQEYFYFCYSEPSDKVKEILKSFGLEYKIIPNIFLSNLSADENTAFIIPKCEQYIKLEFN